MRRNRPPRSSSRLPEDPERTEQRAFELAVRALGRRERTTAEIAAWLSEKDFEAGVVETVLERLTETGGLDDARYARLFAEDKRELESWGSERIRAGLEARGVPARLIDHALVALTNEGETERAAALLQARGEALDSESARGRALAFLVRRGYPSEIAYEAVRRAETLAMSSAPFYDVSGGHAADRHE